MNRDSIRIETLSAEYISRNITQILAIASDVPGEYWSESHFLYELPEKWKLSFCAREGDVIAGYAILSRRSPDTVHLHHFMVARSRRGQGMGAMMLTEAAHRATSANAKKMSLKVGEDNARAIAFYQQSGFRQVDSANGYLTFMKQL